jgi:hypothetical protein
MQAVHWVIAVQFLFQQIHLLLQDKKFLEELSTMPRRKTPTALVPFISSSLNDAVGKTDYTATNDLRWMWKEVLY